MGRRFNWEGKGTKKQELISFPKKGADRFLNGA